jgi:hypothetical protein
MNATCKLFNLLRRTLFLTALVTFSIIYNQNNCLLLEANVKCNVAEMQAVARLHK